MTNKIEKKLFKPEKTMAIVFGRVGLSKNSFIFGFIGKF